MPDRDNIIRLVAVGDVWLSNSRIFDPARSILKEADITFGQLEQLLSERGKPQTFSTDIRPSRPPPPGTAAPQRSLPPHFDPAASVQILADAGFNVVSAASNHSMQHGEEAMLDTMVALKEKNIAAVGAGKNIAEATRPVIFERRETKVGFLAYCSVGLPGDEARPNKSGIAPLRAITCFQPFDLQPGTPPKIVTRTEPGDLAGMIDDIKKLRPRVDVLVVSMHWGVHYIPAVLADYQVEAGHAAIDAGADLILGHHPPILKGIEIYKGKTIFYGLCNFATMDIGFPVGKIERLKSSGRDWLNIFGYRFEIDAHSKYGYALEAEKTMIVKCDIVDRKIQRVGYIPAWINKMAQPEPLDRSDPRSDEHLRYMQWVCGEAGLDTPLTRDGREILVG